MNKYVLSLLFLLTAATVLGQKKSIVNLIKSQSSTGIKLNGKDVVKVYQGTFKQDYSTLTSDSAYFYIQDNAVDAFGHVDIDQGDTLNVYADKLNYNGNTKIAILTDNVRMVDKDATLTTNHLNYNTATRIGVYTDGGKLVNNDNTLLSKNGWYFAFTRDAYFRYDVSLTTPDALVKTDTMRYNTKSKISYFYGPTNIYSTKGEKDKDTLYTENGSYNTNTEQAAFGKRNFYHTGTKSLKGDSLFYDKLKGYGRAVKHVTFNDNEQKVTIKGELGTYFKADERTVVTQDPYVIMVTEKKDTTKTDSVAKADSLLKKQPVKNGNAITMAQLIKKTVPSGSMPVKEGGLKINTDLDSLAKQVKNNPAIKAKADSLIKQQRPEPVREKNAKAKKTGDNSKKQTKARPGGADKLPLKPLKVKDTSKVKQDSIYMSSDTLETRMLTYKDYKIYLEKQRLARVRDTTTKVKKVKVKESKFLTAVQAGIRPDSSYLQRDFFGKPKPVAVKKKAAKPLSKKQLVLDSLAKKQQADSVLRARLAEPNDTTRVRIIIAHHHFKMFKSDLQAKSDSMFYSNADSTMRCFVNPIMWTQGSQLSGDTIYLQMKHKKLDNMTMFPNAFIVNIEKDDSVHFNQVGGKRMRGFFKDDKLNRMFIEGNAESIYFARDSGKMTISGMQRSLSSRIRVDFKNNEATNLAFYTKPENRYGPLAKFKEDEKILKGFIWKPKERPVSKESIIPSFNKKASKPAPGKSKNGKLPLKNPKDGKGPGQTAKDSTLNAAPLINPGLQTKKDSTMKTDTVKRPVMKTGKDSAINKQSPVKAPVEQK